jgi:protein O-mannosyl-transferase
MRFVAIQNWLFFNKTKSAYYLPILVLLCTNSLLLWQGLYGPLIFDDLPNLSHLLGETVDYHSSIFENQAGPFGRIVTMATFAMNHWFSGSMVSFELKISNLFIHLINGILLYYFLFELLKIKLPVGRVSVLVPIVTALWMFNPVNSETVLYTIQRATLLSTLFMLGACIVYLNIRKYHKEIKFSVLLKITLTGFLWALAMLSKENAVVLPCIILCIEFCFFNNLKKNQINSKAFSFFLVTFAIPISLCTLFLIYDLGFLDYANRGYSIEERVFTQPVVLLTYLKDMLFPFAFDIGIYRDDFPVQTTFWNVTTVGSFLSIAIALTIALLNLKNEQIKYLSFGVLVYFCGHLLESTIFPLEFFFWHRNYFPSIGVFLFIVLALDALVLNIFMRKSLIIFSFLYCFLFAQQSHLQAKIWSSYESILISAYEKHPESLRVNLELVGELVKQGYLQKSLELNTAIINAKPKEALPAKLQRLYIYCELANEFPTENYDLFRGELNISRPLLVSSALRNFLHSYKFRECKFIKLRLVIDLFISWIDTQLISDSQTAESLWNIDYYMIEMLFLIGEDEEAYTRLNEHIARGNTKAAYFVEYILNK